MKRHILLLLFALLAGSPVYAQGTIQQSGPVTAGHGSVWYGNGLLGDAGPASGGLKNTGISDIGLIARGSGSAPYAATGTGPFGANFCDYDAPNNNSTGYHFLCFSPNALGGNGVITYGSAGSVTPGQLVFNINGTTYPFPVAGSGNVVGPVSSTVGNLAAWANSTGTLLSSETASQFFDFQFGSAVGTILCRGSSGWTVLGAGTTGYILQSAGNGGCPQWSNPITLSSATVTNVTTTGSTSLSALSQIVAVKTSAASAVTIILPASSNFPNCPASALSCPVITVKDAAGDASTGLITVIAADGKTIDGYSSFSIPYTLQSQDFVLLGTTWMGK